MTLVLSDLVLEIPLLFLPDKKTLKKHTRSNGSISPSTLFINQLMFNLMNKKVKIITEETQKR